MLKQSAAPAASASSLQPPSQCADIARIGTRHVSDCAPAGLYGRLEKESKAGRPLSEIVEDIKRSGVTHAVSIKT